MGLNKIKLIFSPLLSLFLLINGIALFTTIVPLKMDLEGASSFEIGLITAAYYIGLTSGSFKNANFIIRVGHIRAFAAFASLTSAVVLFSALYYSIIFWIITRFVTGYCLAGLYIVIESWIIKEGTEKTRGQYLALYMIILSGGAASGQLLLNLSTVNTFVLFAIIAVLTSLSVIPLAITKVGNPTINEPSGLTIKELFKLSQSGVISCFIGGFLFSTINSLLPLYIQDKFNDFSETALVMFLVLLGGMVLQYPVGKLSDVIDRRKVIVAVCLVVIFISSIIQLIDITNIYLFYFLMFFIGGAGIAVYPLSISHTCDVLESDDIVAGTQGLVLVYGLGAFSGPLLATLFIELFDYIGLFTYFSVSCIFLSAYLLNRIMKVSPHTEQEHQDYVTVPTTTPIAAEMDPRSD